MSQRISPLLQSMLGFRQAIFPAREYVSDWVTDVKKGLNSLYVYCPLVELRMVGDAQVPLLRIVPVEGRDGEIITRVFDPIQYCPLLQRRFQTVLLGVCNNRGKLSYRNDELVSFWRELFSFTTVKCHHHGLKSSL
jgi:uncharacterized protein (UPF0248 family)